MSEAKHSPLPWAVEEEGAFLDIVDVEGELIADAEVNNPLSEGNAEFIVRAVNSHDELVAALKHIACIAVSKAYDIQARDQTAACAFEALKKAGAL